MTNKKSKKVIVALSGGVDSAVSALLLKQQGFNVIGAFMKCWDGTEEGCTAAEDEYWARRAAAHIGVPFYRFHLTDEYKKRVVDYFIQEYKEMRTPNPDIMCNSQIKFGVFFDTVMNAFAPDYIATGHYSQIKRVKNKLHIIQGIDQTKDQSYFLYRINPDVLRFVLFPVGGLEKKEVRQIAKRHSLPNAYKKDSQGICFIGNIKVRDFLAENMSVKSGNVVRQDGEIVGKHNGLAFYTIGQRRGVGSFGGGVPYYVISKNKKQNELIVGGKYDSNMSSDTAVIDDVNFFSEIQEDHIYYVGIRYRQKPQKATMHQNKDRTYTIKFKQPQRAITSGQSAVIYDKNILVGGGIIS